LFSFTEMVRKFLISVLFWDSTSSLYLPTFEAFDLKKIFIKHVTGLPPYSKRDWNASGTDTKPWFRVQGSNFLTSNPSKREMEISMSKVRKRKIQIQEDLKKEFF
jgi:hypothetical protein